MKTFNLQLTFVEYELLTEVFSDAIKSVDNKTKKDYQRLLRDIYLQKKVIF